MPTMTQGPRPIDDKEDSQTDREWRVPTDLFPEGYDDPWVRGDLSPDPELFPLPVGLP